MKIHLVERRDHPRHDRPAHASTSVSDPEGRAVGSLRRGRRDEALEVLMTAYGDSIYRYCRLMLHHPDDAEDAAQMTFISAYKSLGSFQYRSTLKTWLYGIARHRCLDVSRKRKQDRHLLSTDELTVEPIGMGAKEVQSRVASRELEARLARLSAKERSAVLLRHRAGLTFKEIASLSGERPPAVERRVARAIQKLRRWARDGANS